MDTPPKTSHVSTNTTAKFKDSPNVFDYIMNLSPVRPVTSSISSHINLLSSSSLSPSLIVQRIDEVRFQIGRVSPKFNLCHDKEQGGSSNGELHGDARRTARRRCLFSGTAAAFSGSKADDESSSAVEPTSLNRAVSALACLNWEHKSSMSPSYLNHVISLWRELIPKDYAASSSVHEEVDQEIPMKKRTKMEHDSGTGSCKRCSCRKSKCLKLYCECFGSGNYCTGSCLCQNCLNKPIFKDQVLEARSRIESRNPLAFAPKLIEEAETPASAKHRQGCKCKRSACLKKYCECFQGGVGCSFNCRCEGCRNAFGSRNDCGSIRPESMINLQNGDRVGTDHTNIPINTRRHIGAALFREERQHPRRPCHDAPKMEPQHQDMDPPRVLKSSSPKSKRVSVPCVALRNMYHPVPGGTLHR